MNDIMIVRQIPVIEEHLQSVKDKVIERTGLALSMLCTEDTYKQVKTMRAELSKEFKAFEEMRKGVKQAVMQPYADFEATYKDCIADAYKSADEALKEKIGMVEDGLKAEKETSVREYFDELCTAENIRFVKFEDLALPINMSTTLKKLKAQTAEKIEQIKKDLMLIESQEDSGEILIEYQDTLDVNTAILRVKERKHRLAEQEKSLASRIAAAERQKEAEEAVLEAVAPPEVEAVEESDDLFELSFKVTAPIEKLRTLKKFLDDGGYQYEQL